VTVCSRNARQSQPFVSSTATTTITTRPTTTTTTSTTTSTSSSSSSSAAAADDDDNDEVSVMFDVNTQKIIVKRSEPTTPRFASIIRSLYSFNKFSFCFGQRCRVYVFYLATLR